MYRTTEQGWGMTRTLEIATNGEGYHFTIHEGDELLFISPSYFDRVKVTIDGLAYLDKLQRIDQQLRQQQKGNSNGQ